MNRETIHDATSDPRIDRVLESIGSATPTSGLEGRILNRMAAERLRMESRGTPSLWYRLPRLPRQALGLTTACLVGFVIVAGSVESLAEDRLRSWPGAATADFAGSRHWCSFGRASCRARVHTGSSGRARPRLTIPATGTRPHRSAFPQGTWRSSGSAGDKASSDSQ